MAGQRVSRRVALGTAAGVGIAGVVGRVANPAGAAVPAGAATTGLPSTLTTRVPVPSGVARGRRAVGDAVAHVLPLHDPTGTPVGEIVVSGTVLAARGTPTATAAVHHHLFRLAGGTVAGLGTVDLAGHGEFVVVGGTGAHRGATGGYLLTPGPGTGSTLTWEI